MSFYAQVCQLFAQVPDAGANNPLQVPAAGSGDGVSCAASSWGVGTMVFHFLNVYRGVGTMVFHFLDGRR